MLSFFKRRKRRRRGPMGNIQSKSESLETLSEKDSESLSEVEIAKEEVSLLEEVLSTIEPQLNSNLNQLKTTRDSAPMDNKPLESKEHAQSTMELRETGNSTPTFQGIPTQEKTHEFSHSDLEPDVEIENSEASLSTRKGANTLQSPHTCAETTFQGAATHLQNQPARHDPNDETGENAAMPTQNDAPEPPSANCAKITFQGATTHLQNQPDSYEPDAETEESAGMSTQNDASEPHSTTCAEITCQGIPTGPEETNVPNLQTNLEPDAKIDRLAPVSTQEVNTPETASTNCAEIPIFQCIPTEQEEEETEFSPTDLEPTRTEDEETSLSTRNTPENGNDASSAQNCSKSSGDISKLTLTIRLKGPALDNSKIMETDPNLNNGECTLLNETPEGVGQDLEETADVIDAEENGEVESDIANKGDPNAGSLNRFAKSGESEGFEEALSGAENGVYIALPRALNEDECSSKGNRPISLEIGAKGVDTIRKSRDAFFRGLLCPQETIEEVYPASPTRSGGDGVGVAPEPIRTVNTAEDMMLGVLRTVEKFPSGIDKVKKKVTWADAEEGRNLESYESSSEEEEEEEEVDDVEENDDEPEQQSSSGEEDSSVEENQYKDDLWTRRDGSSEPEVDVDETDEEDEEETDESDSDKDSKSGADETVTEDEITYLTNGTEELAKKIDELQTEISTKAASLERKKSDKKCKELHSIIEFYSATEAQTRLDAAMIEGENARRKLNSLEEELDSFKSKNYQLNVKLNDLSNEAADVHELRERLSSLESELKSVSADRIRLENEVSRLESEREMEMQMVQQALDEALKEQTDREARYLREFEAERTLSSQREIQMLEDFEWKLRETEKNGKKRADAAEALAASRLLELETAKRDLERLHDLELCEIEVKQLRTTCSEQRRTLRQVTRQLEEIQVNEKILQEEVNRLRSALDKEKQTITAMQTLHKEEIAEKDRKLNFKLEMQKNQLIAEWEERLKRETHKQKTELEKVFREEKMVAIDTAKRIKDSEISNLKQMWDRKSQEFKDEIVNYKQKLSERESSHHERLQAAQTTSDREALELRRKMDKLDMSYQERIEKMQEDHENEISAVKVEYEKRVAAAESALQQQAGTTRTTIELVKQQMLGEAQTRIDRIQIMHQKELEEQWEIYEKRKETEVRAIEEEHRRALEELKLELEEIRKAVAPVKQQKPVKNPTPERSNQPSFGFGGGDDYAGCDAEKLLLAKIQQLTNQATEDKAEIDRLKQRLAEKEPKLQHSSSQPQIPSRSRRSRKRRN